MSNLARPRHEQPANARSEALERRIRARRALSTAMLTVDDVATRVGDHADAWHFVQCASAWCRGVQKDLAALDDGAAARVVDFARVGHRCARRYPREVGEALCRILLAPGATSEMEIWREVDRARASLVSVLDAVLFTRRTL